MVKNYLLIFQEFGKHNYKEIIRKKFKKEEDVHKNGVFYKDTLKTVSTKKLVYAKIYNSFQKIKVINLIPASFNNCLNPSHLPISESNLNSSRMGL